MISEQALQAMVERIRQIRAKKGSIDASDMDELLGAIGKLVAGEREIYSEIRTLSDKIQKARAEVQAMDGKPGGKDQISNANLELDEVVKATEAASNRIMDAAEKIQGLAGGNQGILDACGEIFEACSFQDITGQRIRKVLGVMGELEQSIGKLMQFASAHGVAVTAGEAAAPQTQAEKDKALLNGPQLTGDKPSQDDIDKLFSSL